MAALRGLMRLSVAARPLSLLAARVPAARPAAAAAAAAAVRPVLRLPVTVRQMSGGPAYTAEEKEAKILAILRCFDRIDASKLTMDAHFIKDLGLDSLDVVECVMAIEEEFAIELTDAQAETIRTPKDMLHYIH